MPPRYCHVHATLPEDCVTRRVYNFSCGPRTLRARAAHHRSMQIDGGERSEKLKIRERERHRVSRATTPEATGRFV